MANLAPDHFGGIQIGVIGPGAADATSEQYDIARQVGYSLARRGMRVVCGGLGGVMEGVARGVHDAQGVCAGLVPGHERAAANHYLSIAICTGIGEKRNEMVIDSSDAVIAIGSNEGTVIEALIAKKGAVAAFGVDFHPVVVGGKRLDDVVILDDWADAVTRAVEAARIRSDSSARATLHRHIT